MGKKIKKSLDQNDSAASVITGSPKTEGRKTLQHTMNLQTIETAGQLSNKRRRSRSLSAAESRVWLPLETSDIPGAQHDTTKNSWLTRSAQIPDHRFATEEIEGAGPRTLIPQKVNKPNNRVTRNDDIELSHPRKKGFRTNRILNPLNPEYKLPSKEEEMIPPPPFRRDPLRVDDIEGAKPAQGLYRKPFRRDPLDCSDINVRKPQKRKTISDPLKVDDITKQGVFKTRRVTDVLNPQYTIYTRKNKNSALDLGDSFEKVVIEPLETKPPSPLSKISTHQPFCLRTDDIEGMKRTIAHHVDWCFPKERRQYRKINDLAGIDGASPNDKYSTFLKSSHRSTNPLDPAYGELKYRSGVSFVKPESRVSEKNDSSMSHRRKPRFAYLFESESKPSTPLRNTYRGEKESKERKADIEMVKALS